MAISKACEKMCVLLRRLAASIRKHFREKLDYVGMLSLPIPCKTLHLALALNKDHRQALCNTWSVCIGMHAMYCKWIFVRSCNKSTITAPSPPQASSAHVAPKKESSTWPSHHNPNACGIVLSHVTERASHFAAKRTAKSCCKARDRQSQSCMSRGPLQRNAQQRVTKSQKIERPVPSRLDAVCRRSMLHHVTYQACARPCVHPASVFEVPPRSASAGAPQPPDRKARWPIATWANQIQLCICICVVGVSWCLPGRTRQHPRPKCLLL